MKSCPECGSAEIIPDLLVFSDESVLGLQPPYVELKEPEPEKSSFLWSPKTVATGFRAAVCGNCGYTRFYTKYHVELLNAFKKGYTSQQYIRKEILPI